MQVQIITTLIIALIVSTPIIYAADDLSELRTKIDGNRGEIQKIENEIEIYKKELDKVQGEKNTLQNAVRKLNISHKKTNATIRLTQDRINNTENKILTINEQISSHTRQIKNSSDGLAQSIRRMHEAGDQSLIELFLKSDTMAKAWTSIESLRQFQSVVRDRVVFLNNSKKELEEIKESQELENRALSMQNYALASDKRVLDINRNAKNSLLQKTKNKESEYQKILKEKRESRESFRLQMAQFEAQLRFILDKNTIPQKGSRIFRWPVENVHITQYFGNTKFAQSGVYNGRGHNGIDFRAPIGTRINTVLSGTVKATNEKVARHCQYGKWVLIKHGNGLTTLYAHLSAIAVSEGQSVVTGQRIGYAGDTGFAFGPHLHLTVYASEAVRFKQFRCSSGPTVRVPVSAHVGYLNPLDYLR